MGSNVSSFNKRNGANAITVPHHHSDKRYNRSNAHRWTVSPSNNDEVETATHHHNIINSNEDQSNVIEIIRPVECLNHSVNTNQVISFHSSARWREYYQASKHSDELIILFFSAIWCKSCRDMDPILDDLATQYTDVEIHKIDVVKLFEIARKFKVTTVPTLLFMKRGKVVDKVIGAMHQEICSKIEKYRD